MILNGVVFFMEEYDLFLQTIHKYCLLEGRAIITLEPRTPTPDFSVSLRHGARVVVLSVQTSISSPLTQQVHTRK